MVNGSVVISSGMGWIGTSALLASSSAASLSECSGGGGGFVDVDVVCAEVPAVTAGRGGGVIDTLGGGGGGRAVGLRVLHMGD